MGEAPAFNAMLRYIQIGANSFIPTFNLLVGVGIALAMLYLQHDKIFKHKDEKYKQGIHLGLLISIVLGFVGAFSFDAYTQNISINFSNLNQNKVNEFQLQYLMDDSPEWLDSVSSRTKHPLFKKLYRIAYFAAAPLSTVFAAACNFVAEKSPVGP